MLLDCLYFLLSIQPRKGKTSLPALATSRVAWAQRPLPPRAFSLELEVRFTYFKAPGILMIPEPHRIWVMDLVAVVPAIQSLMRH
jgi:hypothetical protein